MDYNYANTESTKFSNHVKQSATPRSGKLSTAKKPQMSGPILRPRIQSKQQPDHVTKLSIRNSAHLHANSYLAPPSSFTLQKVSPKNKHTRSVQKQQPYQ